MPLNIPVNIYSSNCTSLETATGKVSIHRKMPLQSAAMPEVLISRLQSFAPSVALQGPCKPSPPAPGVWMCALGRQEEGLRIVRPRRSGACPLTPSAGCRTHPWSRLSFRHLPALSPTQPGNIQRGMGSWSPICVNFGEQVTERTPIVDPKQFGDAHTPFVCTLLF